jgi:15,16-dihydrobiliverdin:ferredoxin oxidoreductase
LQSRPIPSALEVNVSRGTTPATIRSWCYDCRQLRKIRYTYINACESAQLFNGVIYPTHNYDLPLLAIHLLSLGKKKILVVLNFQPLFRDEAYIAKYVQPLESLRDKYQDLSQNLERKFSDANQYFYKYLLFAKTEAETVEDRVYPAYKHYGDLYWKMLRSAQPLTDP